MAPSDETVYAGVTTLFVCVATGIPDPSISWLLNDVMVTDDDQHNITMVTDVVDGVTFVTSTLKICEIDFNDEGTYQCVANVPGLNESASFEIQVQGVVAEIIVEPMNITVVTGTEVTLLCQATGAPPPTVTWTRDGAMAEGTVTNTLFDLTSVNSTLDLGPVNETATYTCSASSSNVTDSASASATVTVQSM